MAKKTFSKSVKQQAVNAMSIGNLTQKQIADKFGCSVATLQVWRKEVQDTSSEDEWEEKEWEEQEEAPAPCKSKCTAPTDTPHDLKRKFWSKGNRIDMLLNPQNVSAEEAIKLANDALQFAHENAQK